MEDEMRTAEDEQDEMTQEERAQALRMLAAARRLRAGLGSGGAAPA
ncbi:hypothetical protein ACFC1T_09175 [Kitasatospora sp. NPDC056076]